MNSNLFAPAAIAAVSGLIVAYGAWRSGKPADPLKPRLMPWRPIIIASATAGILALAYIVHELKPA